MLAICSDLDETRDGETYFETARYLNSDEHTKLGPGLGMEVGNTIYFDMPPPKFSYWNTDESGRSTIRALIRSGHIDCLHSFGDLASSRAHAERALNELSRHHCKLEVWIDHGRSPSNFGQDIMHGQGDVAGSAVYHADITTAFGIKFVWRGRVTSVFGQEIAANRFSNVWNKTHPFESTVTIFKENIKCLSSCFGYSKYTMHRSNRLMKRVRLRSGHEVIEFIRSNPHYGGVSRGDTANGLAETLTDHLMSDLIARGGISILYTHLGKCGRYEVFNHATKMALERLANYSREKSILVTSTSRLLRYLDMVASTKIMAWTKDGNSSVELITSSQPQDWDGLSVYLNDPGKSLFSVNGNPVDRLQHNPADHTGSPSVSIPWTPLEFPRGLS